MKHKAINFKTLVTVVLLGASVASLFAVDAKKVQDSIANNEMKEPIKEVVENKKPKFKFYGFVRNYFTQTLLSIPL